MASPGTLPAHCPANRYRVALTAPLGFTSAAPASATLGEIRPRPAAAAMASGTMAWVTMVGMTKLYPKGQSAGNKPGCNPCWLLQDFINQLQTQDAIKTPELPTCFGHDLLSHEPGNWHRHQQTNGCSDHDRLPIGPHVHRKHGDHGNPHQSGRDHRKKYQHDSKHCPAPWQQRITLSATVGLAALMQVKVQIERGAAIISLPLNSPRRL